MQDGGGPQDKRLLLVCKSQVQSYEAMRQLERAGIDNTVNVEGECRDQEIRDAKN